MKTKAQAIVLAIGGFAAWFALAKASSKLFKFSKEKASTVLFK